MENIRVIIAMSNEIQSMKMSTLLNENGIRVLESCKDEQNCLRRARMLRPDIVIIDFSFAAFRGCEIAKVLCEDNICSTLVLAEEGHQYILKDYKIYEDFIWMIKPINRNGLISTIEYVNKNKARIKDLEDEIYKLKDSMEVRKYVEKAKGILMSKYGITENEAFRKIQKQSMDEGRTMKEIAKIIIDLE